MTHKDAKREFWPRNPPFFFLFAKKEPFTNENPGILIFAGQIVGVTATILGIVAIVLLLTSVIGFCPLYVPLKRSTLKKP